MTPPGQLRTRLQSSLADSRLELGYLIQHQNKARGALRGEGFELATQGWGNVHAGEGLLLSASTQQGAASTVMDNAEVVAQLKGAERSLEQMERTLQQQNVPGLSAWQSTGLLRELADPRADGRFEAEVNGQSQFKPSDGRNPGDEPVERFAKPMLLAEAPNHIAWTTPASAIAYAGQNLQITVQQDLHANSGQTIATVSGGQASLFAQYGPVRLIAANGPASLQAHNGELEVLSEQALTITATDARIDVLAQSKVVLQAGSSAITLEGGDITFSCLGEFKVRAGDHPFLGGSNSPAAMPALPMQLLSRDPFEIRIALKNEAGKAIAKQAIRILRADGTYEDAVTGADGVTSIVARSDKPEDLKIVLADNEIWEIDDPDVSSLAGNEECCTRATVQTEGDQE